MLDVAPLKKLTPPPTWKSATGFGKLCRDGRSQTPGARRWFLVNASANFAPVAAQEDAAALQEVSHCRDGLAVVLRVAAHSKDQIAQAIVGAFGFLEGLFHRSLVGC